MTNHLFRAAHKNRPRSELLEPAGPAEAAAATAAGQPVTSHSMGDLLSLPKQTTCQDVAQPGAIPSQRFLETSFYRNQFDRGYPRFDLDEYHSARQDPFSVLQQRGAYPTAHPIDGFRGPVDEREYLYRPSTPTVSPVRLPQPRMPLYCPLISITSDNAESSVIYQDESDESDDRILEEDEAIAEQGVATGYSVDAVNPFERITTPPEEYAAPVTDSKRSSLTFDRNFFDTIPYIDQTDDANLAEASECAQGTSCNSSLQGASKHTDVDCNSQQTLNVAESSFELDTRSDLYLSLDKSMLFVKSDAIAPSSVAGFSQDDFLRLQEADNSAKCAPNINQQYKDKLDDASNSEDCADESSSTINDDFASSSRADRSDEDGISTPKMYTIMPELHLDLSGLNSDVSSDEPQTEKCWKSPEEVRLGCGRVAALAKHFSKLGDAGLIRFKSTKLADSRQFVSEPDIMTPGKSDERSRGKPCRMKEYKSDSDLTRETDDDDDPRIVSAAGRNVILVDVETDGDFAIQECRLHHCGAKRVTIARFPSLSDSKEQIDIEKSVALAEIEDHDDARITSNNESDDQITKMAIDNSKSQVLERKNPLAKNASMKDSSSKLSLEQQQVIVEQLEQFSNLDIADAPLFIPEKNAEQVPLKDKIKDEAREKLSSLIDTNNKQKTHQDEASDSSSSSSSSQASVRSPSTSCSSVVLSLAKSSLFSEDNRPQTHQHCGKRSKSSCLFIDISHSSATKNRSNDSSLEKPSMLPPRASVCARMPSVHDTKLDVLRVRIARPLCGSEDNLIGATICDKEKADQIVYHRDDESAKLSRSCEDILSSRFLPDSTDRQRFLGNLRKDVDLPYKSCDRLSSEFKEKTRWYRPRSLEELKSRRGSRKQDDSARATEVQKFARSASEKSNRAEDGEKTQRDRCRSLEELKSKESHEQDSPTSATEVQRPDWLPKRLRRKRVSYDRLRGSALELSRESEARDEAPYKWRVERKSQSEWDVSRRKSDSEGYAWSFREISSLKDDDRSASRKQPHTTCAMR